MYTTHHQEWLHRSKMFEADRPRWKLFALIKSRKQVLISASAIWPPVQYLAVSHWKRSSAPSFNFFLSKNFLRQLSHLPICSPHQKTAKKSI